MSEYEDIYRATVLLASMCNGATTQDGTGFNKLDADFGRSLVMRNWESWTPKQIKAAHKMLAKYKKQLARHGFDYDSFPVPVIDESKPDQTISVVDDEILVTYPQNDYAQMDVRNLGKWNREKKAYIVKMIGELPQSVKNFGETYNYTFQAGALETIEEKIEEAKKSLSASAALDTDFQVDGLLRELRPFQRAGVEFLLDRERVLLADQMGTGKSIQTIAAAFSKQLYPCLIICPASLKLNWEREIQLTVPNTTSDDVVILSGKIPANDARLVVQILELRQKLINEAGTVNSEELRGMSDKDYARIRSRYHVGLYDEYIAENHGEEFAVEYEKYQNLCAIVPMADGIADAKFVIANYDILSAWQNILLNVNWQLMVCDESAALKNSTTIRTKTVKNLAATIPNKYLLSGTPMLSRPSELVSQLEILGHLKEFGGWAGFTKRYCGAHRTRFGWDVSGAANLEELNTRLRSVCMIRRTKDQVLTELPDKQRTYVPVEITNRKEYTKAEDDIIRWIGEQARIDEEFRESIAHLPVGIQQQLINERATSAEERARRAKYLVEMEKLKYLAAQGKVNAVTEWVQELVESGEKVVGFGWHKDIVNGMAATFKSPAITGDTPNETRQQYVDLFQNDKECKQIWLNIKSGGVGLTLTAASNCVIMEFGWTPGDMEQAEDRIHRIGQKNAANCWYFVAKDTIEEDIYQLIEKKRRVVNTGTGTTEGIVSTTNVFGDLIKRLKARSEKEK